MGGTSDGGYLRVLPGSHPSDDVLGHVEYPYNDVVRLRGACGLATSVRMGLGLYVG
ncbi:integrase [Sesbania bispinosa]|nr:integrase [Sesbania bispinosa]